MTVILDDGFRCHGCGADLYLDCQKRKQLMECHSCNLVQFHDPDFRKIPPLLSPICQDRASGADVVLKRSGSRFLLQIGQDRNKRRGEEFRYILIPEGITPSDLTSELALELIQFQTLGDYQGIGVLVGYNHKGVCIRGGATVVNFPNLHSTSEVTYAQAVLALDAAQPVRVAKGQSPYLLGIHPEDRCPVYLVDDLAGHPFLKMESKRRGLQGRIPVPIPKDINLATLSLAHAVILIEERIRFRKRNSKISDRYTQKKPFLVVRNARVQNHQPLTSSSK